MQWTIKHWLLWTHLAGLLTVLFFYIIIPHQQDWLSGPSGPRKNQSSSLGSLWWGTPKPLLNIRSKQVDGFAGEAAGGGGGATVGVTGLGHAMSTKNSLQKQMGVGGPYRYILNEPLKCRNSTPFLILLITSEEGGAETRNAIRQTWENETIAMGPGFVRLFLLGTRKISDTYKPSSIENESHVYHDIIQQDYQDTYNNLTIKTLMGMYWVTTYCPNASYVMKTDSDMFVNTEYLIQNLLKPKLPPKQKYFTGFLMNGCGPVRDKNNKWYMPPELYPGERYPPFCSGTGYVFSGDLAKLIYRTSLSIPMLHLEDVYVGVCLANLQIELTPSPNNPFNNWRVPYSSCRYRNLVTSHKISPNDIIKYWNDMQRNCGEFEWLTV